MNKVSPVNAGIDPLYELKQRNLERFPRECGDRPVSISWISAECQFPP